MVVIPTKLSPIKRNNHKGTKDNANEKNKISHRIFLFSILTIFLRNTDIETNIPIKSPVKWNLYPYGESNCTNSELLVGKIPTSKIKLTYDQRK